STFDRLSLIVSQAGTRRSALSALAAAGIGGAALLAASDAEGKKHKKGKKKRKRKCKKVAGKPCTTDKTCCNGKTNNICAVRSGAGNSDKTCCGGTGAKCGGVNDILDAVAPFCCQDFECSATVPGSTGTCQPVPEL
ncbi:MAG: hypothetical protein M3Z20_20365, partial [Chloroflexota bacterium]|nr:hypothetical protein [Chloroflexota bacterium]